MKKYSRLLASGILLLFVFFACVSSSFADGMEMVPRPAFPEGVDLSDTSHAAVLRNQEYGDAVHRYVKHAVAKAHPHVVRSGVTALLAGGAFQFIFREFCYSYLLNLTGHNRRVTDALDAGGTLLAIGGTFSIDRMFVNGNARDNLNQTLMWPVGVVHKTWGGSEQYLPTPEELLDLQLKNYKPGSADKK